MALITILNLITELVSNFIFKPTSKPIVIGTLGVFGVGLIGKVLKIIKKRYLFFHNLIWSGKNVWNIPISIFI